MAHSETVTYPRPYKKLATQRRINLLQGLKRVLSLFGLVSCILFSTKPMNDISLFSLGHCSQIFNYITNRSECSAFCKTELFVRCDCAVISQADLCMSPEHYHHNLGYPARNLSHPWYLFCKCMGNLYFALMKMIQWNKKYDIVFDAFMHSLPQKSWSVVLL